MYFFVYCIFLRNIQFLFLHNFALNKIDGLHPRFDEKYFLLAAAVLFRIFVCSLFIFKLKIKDSYDWNIFKYDFVIFSMLYKQLFMYVYVRVCRVCYIFSYFLVEISNKWLWFKSLKFCNIILLTSAYFHEILECLRLEIRNSRMS